MKKNIIVIIAAGIVVVLTILSLVVFAGNSRNEPSLEEKVSEEIEYMDKYLVSLLGDFNGLTIGSYLKEKKSSNIQMESQQSSQPNATQSTKENENMESNQSNNTKQSNQSSGSSESSIGENIIPNGILDNKNSKKIDWDKINTQIEELYSIWNTISIDLHSLNVNGNSILVFSDYLNESTQNIKKKDKEKSINSITKIYQLLPQYSKSFRPDTRETNILNIQSDIVTAYSHVSNGKWQEAQNNLTNALNQFTNLLNSVNQNFQNQTAVSQCYILINELNKAVKLKDKDIFFIEYQNLMGKMETI